MAEETRTVYTPVADPAALGLAGFALTTFLLSAHNAGWAPDFIWIGAALFYGGLAQLLAGMWEFRNRNVFGCTAFSTYGAFWLSLATFILLVLTNKGVALSLGTTGLPKALGFFVLGFAIFNSYMLLWSTRVNVAVFGVFFLLELTEIILLVGYFLLGSSHAAGAHWIKAGGYVGVATAAIAWYTSAAVVVNGMAGRHVVPVGPALWKEPAALSGSPAAA